MSKKRDVLVLWKDEKKSIDSPVEEYFACQVDFETFRKWREGRIKEPTGKMIKGTGKPLYQGALYPFNKFKNKEVKADLAEWKEFCNNFPHLNPNPRVVNANRI